MKLQQRATLGAAMLLLSGAASALTFNFTFVAGTGILAQQAFIDAGARWSALFTDNVTLDMTVGQQNLNPGVLASAGSSRARFTYTNFKSALTADATSASDALALAALPVGTSFGMLINRTSDNPNGSGSATPYLDTAGANNTSITLTTANAKALGLGPGTGVGNACTTTCDANIVFATAFTWDYNPNDGITAGAYDFVGIATHEIGHALGFVSGVDILDINSPPVNGPFAADQFTFVNSLDLFRYSSASTAAGVIDFTASTTAKYFSLDKGVTQIAGFSTGRNFGDGQQNSHWKDSLGLGIMDPTAGTGELLSIKPNDIQGFDVIGWTMPVPESTTYVLFGVGLVAIGLRRRKGA